MTPPPSPEPKPKNMGEHIIQLEAQLAALKSERDRAVELLELVTTDGYGDPRIMVEARLFLSSPASDSRSATEGKQ